jgi:hypothetical protein
VSLFPRRPQALSLYYVTYMVAGNAYEVGPYESFAVARGHRNDIETYEGVYNVMIVLRGPK